MGGEWDPYLYARRFHELGAMTTAEVAALEYVSERTLRRQAQAGPEGSMPFFVGAVQKVGSRAWGWFPNNLAVSRLSQPGTGVIVTADHRIWLDPQYGPLPAPRRSLDDGEDIFPMRTDIGSWSPRQGPTDPT